MPNGDVNVTSWYVTKYESIRNNHQHLMKLERSVPLDSRAYMIKDNKNASALYNEGDKYYYRENSGHVLDLSDNADHKVYIKRYVNQTRLGLWSGTTSLPAIDAWEAERCIQEVHLADHMSNCKYVPCGPLARSCGPPVRGGDG